MIHARTAIRQALAAALAAGGTAAGARVFDSPSDVRTAFPALVVEDAGELQRAATLPGGADRLIERSLRLAVTAELQQVSGYAAARDSLVADVEAIAAGAALPGVKSIVPSGYAPDISNAGERPIVVGRQFFEVTYITTQGNPAATL
jgi:hypothetical protein